MKNFCSIVPESEREYIDGALAMYDGGWRSGDAEEMRTAYTEEELTDDEISAICDILERYEAYIA